MSVEEMIASLESQKLASIQQYDEAIRNLQGLRGLSPCNDVGYPEPDDTVPPFRPVVTIGKPASEIIIEERGER